MKQIKIILLCSSRFALPALKEFAFFNTLAAVAVPISHEDWKAQVKHTLTGINIPIIELEAATFETQLKQAIKTYEINLGLMMTFPYKLPAAVYEMPEKGFYNVHPGPLPQYRGADPVFHQLVNREKHAAVTVHKLDEGFDTGELVMIEKLKIDQDDSYGMLTTRLANLAATLTGTLVKIVGFDNKVNSRKQDEAKAGYFPRQGAADILINWQTMEAENIYALIKACNPWNKGAVSRINNQVIRILDAEILPAYSKEKIEPGIVLKLDEKGMVVSTINNAALLIHIVYAEEGFFRSGYLSRLGVTVGHQFSSG